MSRILHNEVSSAFPATEDLVLRGKNIIIEGESGTLPLTGAPLGGGGSSNIAVYDPDIAATAGNRYKTWAEVMAAVATWGTVGGELVVRKSGIFQIATVPAGTYDLSSCYIRSDASSIVPTLSFDDGATLSGFPRIVEGVSLLNKNTTTPLHTVSGFGISIVKNGSLVNDAAATQPLLSVPLGANFTLVFDGSTSPLYKNGSSEAVFVEGTLAIDVLRIPDNSFFSQTDIFSNGLSGNGDVNVTSYVLIPGGYVPSHANYDGIFNVQQKSEERVAELSRNQTAFHSINPADVTFTGGTPPTVTSASIEARANGNLVHVLFSITCSTEGVNNTGFSIFKAGGANPLGVDFAQENQYYIHGGGNVSSNAQNEHEYFPAQLSLGLGPDFSLRGKFLAPFNAKIIRGEFTYKRL